MRPAQAHFFLLLLLAFVSATSATEINIDAVSTSANRTSFEFRSDHNPPMSALPPQQDSPPKRSSPSQPAASAAQPASSQPRMARNVLGTALRACCFRPRTGYFRDGFCRTDRSDVGTHVICAKVTAEFLSFSKSRGNDLSTPRPAFQFPGLQPGDRWCLCALRWKEALQAGVAPGVYLESTNERALDYVALADLRAHALPWEDCGEDPLAAAGNVE
eukprot:m.212181 g.212181  ORF g.212181 m.212181 type:complete len:217 (+) comp19780_c0_seq1:118-768(+)